MKHWFRIAAIAGTFATALSAQPSALDAVREFYATYAQNKFDGLPDRAHLARVDSQLSSGLKALIRAAQVKQAVCIKAEPDDKGPWVEGDLFSSNFESFTRFRVSDPGKGNTANRQEFTVDFEYVDRGETFAWKDKAVVIREGSRWVLDDVIYGRTEGFTSGFGSGLRKSLASDPGCGNPTAKGKK